MTATFAQSHTPTEAQPDSDTYRWQLLVDRQPGTFAFFYAVKTTGIFCRPGCASRLPRRQNVMFFDSSQAAIEAGFRACKRCRPTVEEQAPRGYDWLANACRCIQTADEPPSLARLAEQAGLSVGHFQRRFRQALGVTPKQYAARLQAQRLSALLKPDRSVTAAVFEAGFSSSSRAHQIAHARLGMSPTQFKRGAATMVIHYQAAPCALGWVLVAATARGICLVELGDEPGALQASLRQRFAQADLKQADAGFAAVIERVIASIDTPEAATSLPLDIQGTAFQERVWQALRQIPPGSSASYSEIAQRIGAQGAVRAVAGACAANKIALLIPCHRVVRSDGALSGYRWGAARKQALLKRESQNVQNSAQPDAPR